MLRTQQMAGRPHRLHQNQTRGACGSGRTAARSNLLESQSASGIYVPLCLLAFPWYVLWFLLCQFLAGFCLFFLVSFFFPVLLALRLFWRFLHQSRAVHVLNYGHDGAFAVFLSFRVWVLRLRRFGVNGHRLNSYFRWRIESLRRFLLDFDILRYPEIEVEMGLSARP